MKIELYHTTQELKQFFRKEKDSRIATRIESNRNTVVVSSTALLVKPCV